MRARRTTEIDGFEAVAATQRAKLAGRNLRIHSRKTVHAGAPGKWILSTIIIAPMCGASPKNLQLAAITGTWFGVTCENCKRMVRDGAAPAGWVGGPAELVLDGAQYGLRAEIFA